jgi:hypothetical protein
MGHRPASMLSKGEDQRWAGTSASVSRGAGRPTEDVDSAMQLVRDWCPGSLDLRSALYVCAVAADDSTGAVTDLLADAYHRSQTDAFLASAAIDALGVLATRSAHARASLAAILLRLPPELEKDPDARYPLIAACRAVGRVDALGRDDAVRETLRRWADRGDPLVQAEARMQLAARAFSDALLASDRDELLRRLGDARAGFASASESEEARPDAECFRATLDVLLGFARADGPRSPPLLAVPAAELAARNWVGNDLASPQSMRWALRVSSIVRTIRRMEGAIGEADQWIQFDKALLELATLLADWRGAPALTGIDVALARLADLVAAPALGALLATSVSTLRLQAVIRAAESDAAPPAVLDALRRLGGALSAREDTRKLAADPSVARAIESLARRRGREPSVFLAELVTAIDGGDVSYRTRVLPRLAALPLDHPASYSGDPGVDEVTRVILDGVHELYPAYDRTKWACFVDVLVVLLGHVEELRNTLPDFTRCEASDGLGQRASEKDLQLSLFRRLRDEFGNAAAYELTRVGGGRSDSGVSFGTCRFPIEVKHEYSDVTREHVHGAFLAQTDAYAASTDDIGVLLVLDLRSENAAGHAKSAGGEVRSLYGLGEGAWVDSLPPDPGITDARPKAIVVLLVPGNRPTPSGMTTYSRRPRTNSTAKR